jgi:hypothetical protein
MSPHHRWPSSSAKAEYPVFQSAGVQSLKLWNTGRPVNGRAMTVFLGSPLNFATKTYLLTAWLPNSSATGSSHRIFINRLGALNQDVPSLRP